MANKKSWRITNKEIYYSESEKAGVFIYPMKPNLTNAVLLRGRVKRTLKKEIIRFLYIEKQKAENRR